ncbi:MAG: hypothetical protein KKB31_04920 [Nanoarchaeota archaeon]|nr:hypothetical protein [Nanoarchaeota archaeon]
MEKEFIEKVTERITLNLFRVGCDKDNFRILQAIPNDVKTLMKEFNLTKMPMNKRINELEKVGLLKRERWKGSVEPTELTTKFLDLIKDIKEKIKEELPNLI